MSELMRVALIARTDFSYFFRTKWLIAILLSLNLSDMLVVGLVFNRLMGFDYFRFFVPGVVIMGLYAASLDTGRRIWLALREGVVQYYLALPVSTGGLVGAYLIAGGLAGLVYSTSLLAVAFIALPSQAILNALVLLPAFFVLATGLAGLAAMLAALASTHGEFYFAFQQAFQVSILAFSTVFYPLEVIEAYMPAPFGAIAAANPLSLAAEALRNYVFAGQPIAPAFLVQVVGASLPLAAVGAVAYGWVLRKLRVKGKL